MVTLGVAGYEDFVDLVARSEAGDDLAYQEILAELQNEDPDSQRFAAWALGAVRPSTESLAALEQLIVDELDGLDSHEIRFRDDCPSLAFHCAIESLGQHAAASRTWLMLKLMRTKHRSVYTSAAKTLMKIAGRCSERRLEIWLTLARHKSPQVRKILLKHMPEMPLQFVEVESCKVTLELFCDSVELVRDEAASLLTRKGWLDETPLQEQELTTAFSQTADLEGNIKLAVRDTRCLLAGKLKKLDVVAGFLNDFEWSIRKRALEQIEIIRPSDVSLIQKILGSVNSDELIHPAALALAAFQDCNNFERMLHAARSHASKRGLTTAIFAMMLRLVPSKVDLAISKMGDAESNVAIAFAVKTYSKKLSLDDREKIRGALLLQILCEHDDRVKNALIEALNAVEED